MKQLLLTGRIALLAAALTAAMIDASVAGEGFAPSSPSNPPIYKIVTPHISIEQNVVGAGVATTGKAYVWYLDGTVTAGDFKSLDSYRIPYSYTLPPGKTPGDIAGMAINSIDRIYTWYKDGTRSIGRSSDLDAYGAPISYTLPKKTNGVSYTPAEIVDIVISSQDEVITYFSDGRYARGTSRNLGATSANNAYTAAENRNPAGILAIAGSKTFANTNITWYRDGYYSIGGHAALGGSANLLFPFSQHITIYSFRTSLAMSEPGAPQFEGPGPIEVVRSDIPGGHEPVLAPGYANIAVARGTLEIYRKTGERIMSQSGSDIFAAYLSGSPDPVRNLNTFNGLNYCLTAYPQTQDGQGFCVFQAYDTRAAFDEIGKRFVFLANARNYVWQGAGEAAKAPDGECSRYIDSGGADVWSNAYCHAGRRHLLIAVSVSEDPADGFHLYAIKESNYRDWPLLAVNGNQLIVSLRGSENPNGYAALVFELSDMRKGAKRPRYFRLDKEDLDGNENIRVPREQDGQVLTIATAPDGSVFGFSAFHAGYGKPVIKKAADKIKPSLHYTLRDGALRMGKSDGETNEPQRLYYAKFPLSIVHGDIVVKTSEADGAVPYSEVDVEHGSYKTFNCGRLAVSEAGHEVIAFAGAAQKSENSNQLTYDAAFIARPHWASDFDAPVSYKAGTASDPNSDADADGEVIYNADLCEQQGGAASDPLVANRVWMMHKYGGAAGDFKGALAWVDVY